MKRGRAEASLIWLRAMSKPVTMSGGRVVRRVLSGNRIRVYDKTMKLSSAVGMALRTVCGGFCSRVYVSIVANSAASEERINYSVMT
jgi:hypothetical protein